MSKSRILVIDDEKEICDVSKKILERTGRYEVVTSTEGKRVMDLAKQYKPNLILLDVMMPDMDGTQVAEYLFDDPDTKEIPLVFLTALVRKEEAKKGKIGRCFFIAKPINPKELIDRIGFILNSYSKSS